MAYNDVAGVIFFIKVRCGTVRLGDVGSGVVKCCSQRSGQVR